MQKAASTHLPRVLVLLAAYNGAQWIEEQIRSIFDQRDVSLDIVISDDGSTDDTRAIVESCTSQGRVRVTSPPTPTGSAAQNFLWLLRNAPLDDHDFVALADQDDIWDDDKISRACSILIGSGTVGYSSGVTAFWSDGTERILRQNRAITVSDFLFEGSGQGCTFVITAEFVRTLRTFFAQHSDLLKAVHYHDWTLYALARAWRKTWHIDPQGGMRYRQHASNDTGARLSLRGIGKRFALIRDGWYRRQLTAIARICDAAAPRDPLIAAWNATQRRPAGFVRRWQTVRFCLAGGRRRRIDKAILVFAAFCGWI